MVYFTAREKIGGIQMKRRLCALLSAAALCLTMAVPAFAADKTFPDVTGRDWCYT